MRFDEALLLLLLRRRARKVERKRNHETWVQLTLQYKNEGDFYTLLPKIRSQEIFFTNIFKCLVEVLKN